MTHLLMQMNFETAAQIIGYSAIVIAFLASSAANFYFLFINKSRNHWKDLADAQEKTIANLQTDIAELKAENAEQRNKITELEKGQEDLRKANLRLQGLLGN